MVNERDYKADLATPISPLAIPLVDGTSNIEVDSLRQSQAVPVTPCLAQIEECKDQIPETSVKFLPPAHSKLTRGSEEDSDGHLFILKQTQELVTVLVGAVAKTSNGKRRLGNIKEETEGLIRRFLELHPISKKVCNCDTDGPSMGAVVVLMRLVVQHVSHSASDASKVLQHLLVADTRFDIQVSAACNLAHLLTHTHRVEHVIRPWSSLILSVLSSHCIGATSTEDSQEILKALERLARNAYIRSKMVRRRCTVLIVLRKLVHRNLATRSKALTIIKMLACQTIQNHLPSLADTNFDIMAEGMMDAVKEEPDPEQQVAIIHALHRLAESSLSPAKVSKVIRVLVQIAYNGRASDASLASSLSAIQLAHQVWKCQPIIEDVLRMLSSPFAAVREGVLDLLTGFASWETESLLETNAINALVNQLWYGSQKDSRGVLVMCKQLAAHPKARERLLRTKFVQALVHRLDDPVAAAILWDVIETDDGLDFLLRQPSVRPWLISLARHSSDRAFQLRMHSVLVGPSFPIKQQ